MLKIDNYIDWLISCSSAEKPLWNQEMILQNKKTSWNYIDGCMMTAFITMDKNSNGNKYFDFVKDFIDFFIDENGNIKTYNSKEYNLDNINEGRALFYLLDKTGDQKYLMATKKLYNQILTQPRIKSGNFWHKDIYPNQVWLDGLYMALPFYLEYEKRFNNKKNYEDIFVQIKNVVKFMKDENTGLYYHGYDESRSSIWANKKTGLSPNFWLRAEGWFIMSLVDILELLDDKNSDFYKFTLNTLRELIDTLVKYQDETGMWYQIIDKPKYKNNYLETSGSSIVSYAILKAVNLGIISEDYRKFGDNAFKGICNKYLRDNNGKINLGGICLVAGLGGKDNRDGSFKYYMSEPIVENEAKGIAPFLLAYLQN